MEQVYAIGVKMNMEDMEIYCISGNSMTPLLQKGRDAVVLENIPFSNLKKNDIIAFKVKGNAVSDTVCHRVFKFSGKEGILLEKGDHHFKVGQVKEEDYIGRVWCILKDGIPYKMSNPHNKRINAIIGLFVHIYYYKALIYLLFHRKTSIDMMCKDKELRNKFYSSYRAIAVYLTGLLHQEA